MDEEKKLPESQAEENRERRKKKPDDKRKRRRFWDIIGDYRGEYRKVIWPTRQQLTRESVVVIITCIVIGALITGCDMLFSSGYSAIINFFGSL